MNIARRRGFYRQEVNKTLWELPRRYTSLHPVGSGAYGSVWWVGSCLQQEGVSWGCSKYHAGGRWGGACGHPSIRKGHLHVWWRRFASCSGTGSGLDTWSLEETEMFPPAVALGGQRGGGLPPELALAGVPRQGLEEQGCSLGCHLGPGVRQLPSCLGL